MQRAQRNVPVYLREKQQAEEKAQEKLLLLKEQQRDKQYMDEEQVCACMCELGVFEYFYNKTKCVFRQKAKQIFILHHSHKFDCWTVFF